jgi:SAM-dependent methyltransferase
MMSELPRALPDTSTLLRESAPLARALADRCCHSQVGHDGCVALHGIWQDLRLLGLAADPDRHAAFFAAALGAAAGDSPRVLITGSADYGMLATVHAAFHAAGRRLEPTVVDLCATPLMLCSWYGAQARLAVRTVAGDVSRYHDAARFDLICTHSLLRYFAVEQRPALLRHWAGLLRPGGRIITVTRLDEDGAPFVSASAAHADGFVARVRAAAAGADPGSLPADLDARARRFALAPVSHPMGGPDEVRALFSQAGLRIERLDVSGLGGTLGGQEAAPGTARGARYAEIVAIRD